MTGWRLESVGRDETDYLDSAAEADDVLGAKIEPIAGSGGQEYVRRKRPRRSRMGPIFVLIAVILLFALSAWYVFQRFGSSNSAEVPIIRADTAPISRQPDEPGGLIIPNQDRVVLERGEVDETVLAGGVETDNGTVPITDLPLNIDSSSDVAELSVGEAGQQASDVAALIDQAQSDDDAQVVDEAQNLADTQAQETSQTVDEIQTEVAATVSDVASEASTEAVGIVEEAADTVSSSVDTGLGSSAPATDQASSAVQAATEGTKEVADGDGPTVLIERLQDQPVADGSAIESALDAEVEQLADETVAAVGTTQESVVEAAQDAAPTGAAEQAATNLLADAGERAEGTVDAVTTAPSADVGATGVVTSETVETVTEVAEVAQEGADASDGGTGARLVTVPDANAAAEAQTEQVSVQAEEASAEQVVAVANDQAAQQVEATIPANPAGGFRVQVSSVQSEAAARQFWAQLSSDHPDLLGALDLTVEQATVNGLLYNRVQAGPLDEAGATSLCDGLKSRGQDCILVRR